MKTSFVDIIRKKRDGGALSREELDRFVAGVTDASVPDYQISALLMAITLRGMTDEETIGLTDAMARSGDRLAIGRHSVGKHSTGGVGDKASIMLAPIVAACGVVMPKISGRGLGHTGGTLDKLESIPGFRVDLSLDEFTTMLGEVGTSIIGPTAALAPADRKLYALRDVTATVRSVPLIAASVMCKKLAEGTGALVLDVKCGAGAYMVSEADARALSRLLVVIGTQAGLRTVALITRMEAPLGRAVGNALEVAECVEALKGGGAADLMELVETLASHMLAASGRFSREDAGAAVREALASGAALEKLRRIVEWQGGDPRIVEDPGRLPAAAGRRAVAAGRDGYVAAMRADLIGRASMALGAGRETIGDRIDHAAGILIARKPGEAVRAGETILELLYNDERGVAVATALAREAIRLSDAPPAREPLLIDTIT